MSDQVIIIRASAIKKWEPLMEELRMFDGVDGGSSNAYVRIV